MKELFKEMRERSKEKRSSNREKSADLLKNSGINFERKNCGAHLIILSTPKIDFYPGTGLWKVRGENKKRRGVLSLLKFIKEMKNDS
jgi:hypothetical protein|nr:MAG TPA: matrix protein [Caudoviricetes sp.]